MTRVEVKALHNLWSGSVSLQLRLFPSTSDRSPPPEIAQLHLRPLPSTSDRSPPPETAPSTWDRSPPPAFASLNLRRLRSISDRTPPPETALLHLRQLPSTCDRSWVGDHGHLRVLFWSTFLEAILGEVLKSIKVSYSSNVENYFGWKVQQIVKLSLTYTQSLRDFILLLRKNQSCFPQSLIFSKLHRFFFANSDVTSNGSFTKRSSSAFGCSNKHQNLPTAMKVRWNNIQPWLCGCSEKKLREIFGNHWVKALKGYTAQKWWMSQQRQFATRVHHEVI